MQRTGQGQGRESSASVQRDPDGATPRVVVCCDRCPSETTDGSEAQRYKWATVAIGVGLAGQVKMLALCAECARSFRVFMLSTDLGAKWERIVDDESRKAVAQ